MCSNSSLSQLTQNSLKFSIALFSFQQIHDTDYEMFRLVSVHRELQQKHGKIFEDDFVKSHLYCTNMLVGQVHD